jgi:hypothetical protein
MSRADSAAQSIVPRDEPAGEWTREPPAVEGYYWVREQLDHEIMTVLALEPRDPLDGLERWSRKLEAPK